MLIDTKKLQKAVLENKKNHNFNTTDIKFELLSLYGEVNELFQAWLKDDPENINEELADVAIFLLGISEMVGSDLGEDIIKKMEINKKRKYIDGKKIEGQKMTHIELIRFRIKKGKEKKAQEWMNFLNEHHVDTVKTMAAEKMYVETVFSEKKEDGYTYFYWYSVQGENGQNVEESESYIDKKHIEYWDECIDSTYHPVNMKVRQSLIAPEIEKIINEDDS